MIESIDLNLSDNECAKSLNRAFTETGFAYVQNHGVSSDLINKLKNLSSTFFELPEEKKNEIAMEKAGRAWRGYFSVGKEFTAGKPDIKEGIYFGTEHSSSSKGVRENWPMHGKNLWPSDARLSVLPETVTLYMESMENLARRLMSCVALGLGLEEDYFAKRFTSEPTTLFRIFNYPKGFSDRNESWGVGEHTDMGFLTILLQDGQPGLQVQTRAGEWIEAPPKEGSFIINIGDMLQFWTHGIFKATLHRVRNSGNVDRMSFPYFYDPNWRCNLTPIDTSLLDQTLLKAAQNDRFRQRWDGLDLSTLDENQTYGDFVWEKIRSVFPNLDK